MDISKKIQEYRTKKAINVIFVEIFILENIQTDCKKLRIFVEKAKLK